LKDSKFIQFVCFIIQFKFKLLNIEDIRQDEKDKQRKELCNLLFNILENCKQEMYYYPIRALTEFYAEKDEERLLGKRLNSENLLCYKNVKEWRGRVYQLVDFNKKQSLDSMNVEAHEHQQYHQLYQCTIATINQITGKFDEKRHIDCFIMCLKIIRRVLDFRQAT
jgi:hypothetical protein